MTSVNHLADWNQDLASLLNRNRGLKIDPSITERLSDYFKIRNDPHQTLQDFEQLVQLSTDLPTIVKVKLCKDGNSSEISIYSVKRLIFKDMIEIFNISKLDIEVFYEFFVELNETFFVYRYQITHNLIKSVDQKEFINDVEKLLCQLIDKELDSDPLHGLVQEAGIDLENINILILYRNYFLQIVTNYRVHTINNAILNNPEITYYLIKFFINKFEPSLNKKELFNESKSKDFSRLIELVSNTPSLSLDEIFRILTSLVGATVRTNYYQKDRDVLAIKIDCYKSNYIPSPKPVYEIFVSSGVLQGTHLRGGKVARGGLRFSDRWDDFRIEILGLMRTQMLKNTVIVPVGSKGGFIVKKTFDSKEQTFENAKVQYRRYITSLLSITDNIVDDKIVPPKDVVRYDDDDPYFVVAADKGTATFSDVANEVSVSRNFWLKDAFASGGANGYSHKDLGITAKGAWECVKHHFKLLGKNIQEEPFTVIGIGDMFGDVFGNGMILSDQIKLVGAFNHQHIFIDPKPNSEKSYQERVRMFNLPKSSWKDYQVGVISKGGGVFDRNAKVIQLSSEIRSLFKTNRKTFSGNEMIKSLLTLDVDLLWNGGVGTYIKSSKESHHDVSDGVNDLVRVNGSEVKARIIGEGGNLGITPLGRIEYEKNGGRINADLIDNSAGVDLSDHEVNIKIFLQEVNKIAKNIKERNKVIKKMTDETIKLCLANNEKNAMMITLDQKRSMDSYGYFLSEIEHLENYGLLIRDMEKIPSNETLLVLAQQGHPFPRSILSVLGGYVKSFIYTVVIKQGGADHSLMEDYYLNYFPQGMKKMFDISKVKHRLKKEIIATQLVNDFCFYNGISFLARVANLTNKRTVHIVKKNFLLNYIYNTKQSYQLLEDHIEGQDFGLYTDVLLLKSNYLQMELSWFLVNTPDEIDFEMIKEYRMKIENYRKVAIRNPEEVLNPVGYEKYLGFCKKLEALSLSVEDKKKIKDEMLTFFNQRPMIETISQQITYKMTFDQVDHGKSQINNIFSFNNLQRRILSFKTNSKWERIQAGITFNKLNSIRMKIYDAHLKNFDEEKFNIFVEEHEEQFNFYKEELTQYFGQDQYVLSGMETILFRLEFLFVKK